MHLISDRPAAWLKPSYANNAVQHHQSKPEPRDSPSSSPTFAKRHSQPPDFDRASQESLSSMPDPVDPTTITKTFKAGRKASAQANLASRSKTPNSKSRRRRNKGHNKNSEGQRVDTRLPGYFFLPMQALESNLSVCFPQATTATASAAPQTSARRGRCRPARRSRTRVCWTN